MRTPKNFITILCFHRQQYLTLMFSLMIFWPGAYTGPKATVNCANSQVALDDTAERRSVHVKHAYVMECVEAETGRHGEKRHLTEAEQRGKEKDN